MAFKAVNVVPFPYPGLPHDAEAYKKQGIDFNTIVCKTDEQIIAAASDADVVITIGQQPLGRNVIQNLKKCRLIHNLGIGHEGLDDKAATEHGICVSTAADYCLEEMSDHTMALILACARKITRLDRAVRAGKWDTQEKLEIRTKIWPPMSRLRGQTLGLIGFGNVPRTLVPKAKGFGLGIIVSDPYVSPKVIEQYGVRQVELEYLLQSSDYISVHAALTSTNHHMLGLGEFQKMKPTAYLINTARGPLIDEKALHAALLHGYMAGAGLDVLEVEESAGGQPPLVRPDHPLVGLDNVVLTAHSAHFSNFSAAELRRRPFEEISRIIDRKWPRCFLNPQVKGEFMRKWGEMKEVPAPV